MNAPPKKLFILDDETEIVEILKPHFEKRGFQVTTSPSGEEALKLLLDEPADLLLLDYKLKDTLTGLDVLRKLRQYNISPRVIFSTGRLEDDVKKEAESLGIKLFLNKPVLLADLDKVIEEDLNSVR